MKATLILADGSVWSGVSIGTAEEKVFELVFNTAMTGYQELLTDPSYAGQGVVMSYPLIGNYGANHEDVQSRQTWVEALVVRHLSERGSNFRCEESLDNYLKEHGITGIAALDTRALTKKLRSQGTMNAMVTCAEHFSVEEKLEQIRTYRVTDAVGRATCRERTELPGSGCRVALLDLGARQSLIDSLTSRGCGVTRFPADTRAEEILSGDFDGVMLSNGPGDPAQCAGIVEEVKKLYAAQLPILAVGLGHQLVALAAGASTERLPYGHRGVNHPVRDRRSGRVYITSQNHGYTVRRDSVDPAVAEVSYENVNDSTVEGLRYCGGRVNTVQFQPKDDPGQVDTACVFDEFVAMMGGKEHA